MPPASDVEKLLRELSAVWRFAVHLCEIQHAEILVQETFLRALQQPSMHSQINKAKPRLLLFRILYDVTLEHAANKAAVPPSKSPSPRQPVHSPQLDLTQQDVQLDSNLQEAVCGLPLRERAVFLLSDVERLRYSDIASIVDLPSQDVGRLLNEARQHVAERLKPSSHLAPADPLTNPLPDKDEGDV